MKKFYIKPIQFAIALFILWNLASITTIQAVENPNKTINSQKEVKPKNDNSQKRCEKISVRIDERKSNIKEKKEIQKTSFENISNEVDAIIKTLENKYDISELLNDKKILDTLREEFATNYGIFEEKLEKAKQTACTSEDKNLFRIRLQEANLYFDLVQQKSKEILQFIRLNIIQDLKSLKKQLR